MRAGKAGLVASSPPQETFPERFNALEDREQDLRLSSVQRVAELMNAGQLDAAPLLSSGSVSATARAVNEVIAPEAVKPK